MLMPQEALSSSTEELETSVTYLDKLSHPLHTPHESVPPVPPPQLDPLIELHLKYPTEFFSCQ